MDSKLKNTKILMVGTDRKLFEKESAVRERVIEYGLLKRELHIIVFAKKSLDLKHEQVSNNVWLYPTNSLNRWCYIRSAIKIGKSLMKKEGFGLITTQDPFETGLVGWRVARAFGARLQMQIHTDLFSPYFSKNFLNKIRIKISKFLLPKADCIRVVSERIKNSLITQLKIPTEKISVLPIFVDTEKIKNTEPKFDLHQKYPQFDFVILMVGRLEKEKNFELAIEVFQKVLKNNSKAGLVIVGSGSLRASLELKVKKLGLKDNVIFEGVQLDVISYYKTADLFLHTSNYEGYGLVLVEATVSECPILTTDIGVVGGALMSESIEVYPVNDKKCLVEKISKILDNRNSLKKPQIKSDHLISKNSYLKEYKNNLENCL
jgi:glycosyltransferase involved in cell wall biosynthesis